MAFKRSGVRTPPGSTNFYHLINGLKESALADVIERGRMGRRRRDALTKHATRRCPTDTPWSQRPRRDAQPDISAYDALALMPTDKAAFSYQPKDLKSVCRGVRARFLLDEFLGREPTDLPWTFRDTLRLTFVSLGRKTRFLVARLRHQINGEVSRQVIGCQAGLLDTRKALVTRVGAGESSTKAGAKAPGARRTTMLRRPRTAAALCFVAALGSLCVFATSADAAKHRSSSAAKHRAAKQRPVTPAAKPAPTVATDQTPTNKNDCLTVSQILFGRAEALSKRAKQAIPREFTRVVSNLDESCGEEDFEKARISIDWMNTCLANFAADYKLGFCTRDKSYFCAINPRSDGCLQSQ